MKARVFHGKCGFESRHEDNMTYVKYTERVQRTPIGAASLLHLVQNTP